LHTSSNGTAFVDSSQVVSAKAEEKTPLASETTSKGGDNVQTSGKLISMQLYGFLLMMMCPSWFDIEVELRCFNKCSPN
jgi:hypothetical protein